MEVIRDEVLNVKKRLYVYAPKRYSAARAKLDEGIQLLCASDLQRKHPKKFNTIKEQGLECQAKMDAYAIAWSAILAFDIDHANPYAQGKIFGRDAFTPKASMGEMLRELQKLGSAGGEVFTSMHTDSRPQI